jgi:hypothetical protein
MIRAGGIFLILAALLACDDANRPSGGIPVEYGDPVAEQADREGLTLLQVELIETAVRRWQREQGVPVHEQRFGIVQDGEFDDGFRFTVSAGGDQWSVLLDPESDAVLSVSAGIASQ